MSNNLFSGLEDLGFDSSEDLQIFDNKEDVKKEKASDTKELSEDQKQKNSLYDKEVVCPVCGHTFKTKAVKTSSTRVIKKDSDFMIRYDVINPYFYDVWICDSCGYSNMKADFPKIKEFQKEIVRTKITPKWHGKEYPEIYDTLIAIERYKIALYNSVVYGAEASKKAMNCLKIGWIYRLIGDQENEKLFLKQALEGFNDAYLNEHSPIYGMDQGTMMYLIGELYRRTEDYDHSMVWFSKLITSNGVEQKIKDMARDQKDLIKETTSAAKNQDSDDNDAKENSEAKKGFFSKLFGK